MADIGLQKRARSRLASSSPERPIRLAAYGRGNGNAVVVGSHTARPPAQDRLTPSTISRAVTVSGSPRNVPTFRPYRTRGEPLQRARRTSQAVSWASRVLTDSSDNSFSK